MNINRLSGLRGAYSPKTFKIMGKQERFTVDSSLKENSSIGKADTASGDCSKPLVFTEVDYEKLKEQSPNLSCTYDELLGILNENRGLDFKKEDDADQFLKTLVENHILSQEDYDNSATVAEDPRLLNKIQPAEFSIDFTYEERMAEAIDFEKRQIEVLMDMFGKNSGLLCGLQGHLDSLERTSDLLSLFDDYL